MLWVVNEGGGGGLLQFLTPKPKIFQVKKVKVQIQPQLNFDDKANFLRRFDSSTNVPLNKFGICLVCELSIIWQKLPHRRRSFKFWKNPFFQKFQNLYFVKNFAVSFAFYGFKKFELRTGHWAFNSDLVNRQKRPISAFWVDDFPSIFEFGRK